MDVLVDTFLVFWKLVSRLIVHEKVNITMVYHYSLRLFVNLYDGANTPASCRQSNVDELDTKSGYIEDAQRHKQVKQKPSGRLVCSYVIELIAD